MISEARYVKLWRQFPTRELEVRYEGEEVTGVAGFFEPNPEAGHSVGVVRRAYTEPVTKPSSIRNNGELVDLDLEAVTLCLSYGYYLSFLGATSEAQQRAYKSANNKYWTLFGEIAEGHSVPAALGRGLLPEEKTAILAEAETAMQLGRQFVPDDLMPLYERSAGKSLEIYRFHMGLRQEPPLG